MRIVRLANFVMPRSGGLRTALRCLGAGYLAAGHEPILIVPGDQESDVDNESGRVITLPGVALPGTGGYRVLLGRNRLAQLLAELKPDRIEVSDRFTLRWTGAWARSAGVPSVMVSHESLAGLLAVWRAPRVLRRLIADVLNARTARTYDRIVCTTGWAAGEFARIGATNVVRVPLGVDLAAFQPGLRDPGLRATFARHDQILIVHCGRLSPEKRPQRSVEALRSLHAAGVPAVLVIAGDGPLRSTLERRAAGLPVHFVGFLDRARVAALLATADVVVAPGPVETFGLAALEALACGTPAVVSAESALPEVVGEAGVAVPASACSAGSPGGKVSGRRAAGEAFAAGIRAVLARPERERRAAARARAERFGWPVAVAGFLAAHGGEAAAR
jgi:alpha-1,6-mannosyltransferase